MNPQDANDIGSEPLRRGRLPEWRAAHVAVWSFIYVFFSNGTPFDSPNRSEPCPLS
jgi:hypothetical protein